MQRKNENEAKKKKEIMQKWTWFDVMILILGKWKKKNFIRWRNIYKLETLKKKHRIKEWWSGTKTAKDTISILVKKFSMQNLFFLLPVSPSFSLCRVATRWNDKEFHDIIFCSFTQKTYMPVPVQCITISRSHIVYWLLAASCWLLWGVYGIMKK